VVTPSNYIFSSFLKVIFFPPHTMKVVSLHTMNIYGGVEVELLAIFNISPRLRLLRGQIYSPAILSLVKVSPPTPTQFPLREWVPEPVQMFERRKTSLTLSKLSNP
jgi:hypothetical protein